MVLEIYDVLYVFNCIFIEPSNLVTLEVGNSEHQGFQNSSIHVLVPYSIRNVVVMVVDSKVIWTSITKKANSKNPIDDICIVDVLDLLGIINHKVT